MTTEELQVMTIRNAQNIISWATAAVAQDRWLESQRDAADSIAQIISSESDVEGLKAKLKGVLEAIESDRRSFESQSLNLRVKAQGIMEEAIELATAVQVSSEGMLEKMQLLDKKVAELEQIIEIIISDSRADRLRITALENRC
jgi:hypothetical protein